MGRRREPSPSRESILNLPRRSRGPRTATLDFSRPGSALSASSARTCFPDSSSSSILSRGARDVLLCIGEGERERRIEDLMAVKNSPSASFFCKMRGKIVREK